MSGNLDLKDSRVPTFIPFENSEKSVSKPAVKRKRTAKSESAATRPQKKKASKSSKRVKQSSKEPDHATNKGPIVHDIWIGAAVNNENGAFAIYHGENDQRNYTQVFDSKDVLEDLEYAYVLGVLKASEMVKAEDNAVVINTNCRDLPRAISGKAKTFQYADMANEILDIIKNREQSLSVRYISGRHAPEAQKAALALAEEALDASNEDKQEIESLNVRELTQVVEKESDQVQETIIEKEDTIVVSTVNNDDHLNNIVQDAIDAVAETNAESIQEAVEAAINPTTDADAIVETQVETTVETTVQVKVIEKQVDSSAAEPMDLVEEEEQEEAHAQAPKSSWATVLGLQSIINVLSSPFKARRN